MSFLVFLKIGIEVAKICGFLVGPPILRLDQLLLRAIVAVVLHLLHGGHSQPTRRSPSIHPAVQQISILETNNGDTVARYKSIDFL